MLNNLWQQKHLQQLKTCSRNFEIVLELTDIDLSIFQDAIAIGTITSAFHLVLPHAVAHLTDMLTERQRDMEGFERWYRRIMDFIVFETSEEPILIED